MNKSFLLFFVIAALIGLTVQQVQAQHSRHKSHMGRTPSNDVRIEELMKEGNRKYDAASKAKDDKIAIQGYEGALRLYRKIISLPHASKGFCAAAYFDAGLCSYALKRYDEALTEYRQVLPFVHVLKSERSKKISGIVYGNIGDCLSALNRPNQAIESYRKAILHDRNDAQACASLGNIYYNQRRYTDALVAYERALHINPSAEGVSESIGDCWYQISAFDKAISAYQNAIRLNPKDFEAYAGIGNAYLDLHRYTEAIQAYRQALRLDPSSEGVFKSIGDCFNSVNQKGEAVKAYQNAVRLNPNYSEAYVSLGETYSGLSENALAADAYVQAGKLEPKDYISPGENFSLAGLYYRFAKQYTKAIEAYALALKQNSTRNDHFDIAFCYWKLGDRDNTEKELAEGEKASTDKAKDWYDFGDSLYTELTDGLDKLRDDIPLNKPILDMVLKACEKSIQFDKGDLYYAVRSYFRIGDIYSKLGKVEEASENYKKPLTLKPTGSDKERGSAYSHMANEYALHKMPEEEETACKMAIRDDPTNADAHSSLAGIYGDAKRYPDAVEEYELSYKLKPEYYTGYLLGLSYESQNKIEEAIQTFESVSARFPDHYDIYFSLGDAYEVLGRKQEASAARRRPLRLKWRGEFEYDTLSNKYIELGMKDEAFEVCQKGVAAFPNSAILHHHLGEAYLRAGNRQAALQQYSLLKALDADYAKLLFDAIYP